jgi:type I restriction enzyme S subunit
MELRPGYKQTEVGVIPEEWEVSSVGSMGGVRSGKALAVNAPGELRPYLRTTNVLDGKIVLEDVLWMPMTDVEFSRFQVLPDDVLLNEGQTTELVGRCAIYNGEYGKPCTMQNQLLRFRAKRQTAPQYAAHLFRQCQKNGVFAGIATQTTSVAHLGLKRFESLQLAWPTTKAEQKAIAAALSDADALIESLEQLIQKKRLIKQGAMQELLTGKRRLPGFAGEWEHTNLGSIALIKTGSRNNQDKVAEGEYPFFVRSAQVERINCYSYDCEAILVPGEGGIGSIFHYIQGKFEVHQRVYAIRQFVEHVSGKFVYFHMTQFFGNHAFENSVKATVDSLRLPTFQNFAVRLPPTLAEQEAIAAVLSDIDAEIESLKTQLSKARQVKQGMMYELLTGRIRLI